MSLVPSNSSAGLPRDLFGRVDCHKSRKRRHDKASYIWLAYSVFFFIEPILRHSRSFWIHQAALYALFLAIYVAYVQFESNRIRIALIAAIFVLAVTGMPFNTGASCFFIYVAAMLPFCVQSAPALWAAMLIEIATLAVENHFFPGNPFNYLFTAVFILVVGVSNLFVAQAKRADQKLRLAQEENVALAAVAERERIARDLHDVLGHTLSVIVLKAELAGRLLDRDPARAAQEIADVERTARSALSEVREAIGGYRAKGLGAELEQARRTLDAAGVALRCDSHPPVLEAREETVLSLAVREAVTNIVRHARASECRMSFTTSSDGFTTLEVADNGSAATLPAEGNGLRGMRERVQQVGGRLHIDFRDGTRLRVELPGAATPRLT